jgi:hypothetical protein
MALPVGSQQLGVGAIRLAAQQLALCVAGDARGVHHANPITQPMQVFGNGFVVDPRRLHHDPGIGCGMFFQPPPNLLEALGRVGQLAFRAVLAVGLKGGDIEAVLGDIDADDGRHGKGSCAVFGVIITALGPTL